MAIRSAFIEDLEARFEHAKSAGATIIESLHETEYGELQYGAEDLDRTIGCSRAMPET